MPVPAERLERHVEHTHERGERSHLCARGHERGHRRRRTLVHVGCPHVEGHSRNLEPEADRQQGHGRQREGEAVGLPCKRPRHRRQARGTRCAVSHRDTVQEERGGEGSQQEVLHRALDRADPSRRSREHVQRQGQDLEREEHRDQVGRGRDQRHPGRREEDERIELWSELPRALEVVVAEQQAERRHAEQDQAHDHREPIGGHGAGEHRQPAVPVPEHERGSRSAGDAGHRDEQEGERLDAPDHRSPEQHQDARADEDQLGHDGSEVHGRRHCPASCAKGTGGGATIGVASTPVTSFAVVGSMRSSRTFG